MNSRRDRTDNFGGDPPHYHDHSPMQHDRRSWDEVGQRRCYQERSFVPNNRSNSVDKDQWGRQRMSQVSSPQSSSRKNNDSIRHVMDALEQVEHTPSTAQLSQGSQKKVTFSQLPDEVEHFEVATSTPIMNDSDVQFYEESQSQTYQESGGFMRTQDNELESNRASFVAQTEPDQNVNFDAFAHGGQEGITSSQQSQNSSKRRKKRRTAD